MTCAFGRFWVSNVSKIISVVFAKIPSGLTWRSSERTFNLVLEAFACNIFVFVHMLLNPVRKDAVMSNNGQWRTYNN